MEHSEAVRPRLSLRVAVMLAAVSLVLVVGSVAVQFALARPRTVGNEPSAISSLRTILAVNEQYRARFGRYGGLEELQEANYVDVVLGTGTKSGYEFVGEVSPAGDRWSMTAVPLRHRSTGVRSFRTDQSGIIRSRSDGGVPRLSDPMIEEQQPRSIVDRILETLGLD